MRINPKLISLSLLLLIASALIAVGCDKRKEAATASAPGTSVESILAGDIITTKIKSGLLADPVVKGLDPQIETHEGVVRLSGFAENQAQMDRVTEIARTVGGVRNVENKMNIRK